MATDIVKRLIAADMSPYLVADQMISKEAVLEHITEEEYDTIMKHNDERHAYDAYLKKRGEL